MSVSGCVCVRCVCVEGVGVCECVSWCVWVCVCVFMTKAGGVVVSV